MAQIASEPPSWNTGSGAGSSFAEEVGANAISDDEDDSWLANDLVSKSLIASLTEVLNVTIINTNKVVAGTLSALLPRGICPVNSPFVHLLQPNSPPGRRSAHGGPQVLRPAAS